MRCFLFYTKWIFKLVQCRNRSAQVGTCLPACRFTKSSPTLAQHQFQPAHPDRYPGAYNEIQFGITSILKKLSLIIFIVLHL